MKILLPRGPAALALSTLLALAAALPAAGGTLIDRILVRVNGRIITQSQLDARVEQAASGAPANPAQMDELRRATMEELVNEALLEDRARDLDLVTHDTDVEDQINRLKEQNNVKTDAEFEQAVAASGLTVERLREQLKKTLTVQRVVGREVNSKVDLSDDALRLIYEREKETWRVAESVHIAEILIGRGEEPGERAASERKANEASQKLKAGAKWEEVVADYSEGATKARGGDLGTLAKGELAPEIDGVAFSLPAGGVSDPIGTRFGWHIVKLIEKFPATYRPFAEVKADLLKREQETQFQKKLAEYLDKLKQDAIIRVSADASRYYTAPASSKTEEEKPAEPAKS